MVKDSKGPIDFVMLFAKSQTELKTKFARSAEQLAPAGMLWVSWPKRASGVPTDMNENDVRRIGLEEDWSTSRYAQCRKFGQDLNSSGG
jgi:hypothetical protein